MLTVACVLRPSKDFDEEYVMRLKAGVEAHLAAPHRFICLSNVTLPCERLLVDHDWPGWWLKLELFRLPPPVLYFDLDTIIVGDLGDIAAHAQKSPFTTLRDFYREKGIGSGMMSWAVRMTELYDAFAANPPLFQDRYNRRGDQAFLEDHVTSTIKWQDVLPGQVCSYKAHVKGKGVPDDCRVICFHGKPRPRDIGWTI